MIVDGTVISYDDWFLFPTVRGGEIKGHLEISNLFLVEFEEIHHVGYGEHNLKHGYGSSRKSIVFFRVRSIGLRSCHGISEPLSKALQITNFLRKYEHTDQ